MNKKVAIIISPNWHDYAEKYLDDCIESLRQQDYNGEIKFFITDNETSDESFSFLKNKLPDVTIIRNEKNGGFAEGNNLCIEQALNEKYEYIILFNMDTEVDKACVTEMVKIAESNSDIGAVQARLMLWNDKYKINSLGNSSHFLGFGYCLGYNEEIKDQKLNVREIMYPSGSAVLFKHEVLVKIGLFDEELWMYNEDQDLGWKCWLAGYKCVLAPDAVTYHKYEFVKSIKQYYWMDRNRIIEILKCYHILTLCLIAPMFLFMECGLLLFSLKTGWFKEKLNVWKYFFTPKTWKYLIKERHNTQKIRLVKDKDIVYLFSGTIWYQEVDDWKLRLINPIFNLYWNIAKLIIIW